MTYGSTNQVLRVNLTSGKISTEKIPDELYRLYPGGKALAGYYLLSEMPAHIEPFDPQNMLNIANGLLSGSPIAASTRFVVTARSPLTESYGESEAGGFWGPELKMAGFEAIIITGKAPTPVYLWIQDGKAKIQPADHLWGRSPADVQADIRNELGDDKIRILQIGVAGENRVLYACIGNDLRHFNGRNGMGAVMGSKNLRAVAVRGRQRYNTIAYNPKDLSILGRKLAGEISKSPQALELQVRGTPGFMEAVNAGGVLPTHNFRKGAFEGIDEIKWEAYEKKLLIARRSCYACAIRCKREIQIDEKPSLYGGPEYESVAAFGSNCGIDDIEVVAKANERCNYYMMDVISTAGTIAFAMECFEHGLLSLADTDGIDLRFGNAQAMLTVIELIAHKKGLGKLLAEGTRRAAEIIGGEAHHFAMQVKGQELPLHEVRGKYNVGMAYAVSEIGADHLVTAHDGSVANPESITFKKSMSLGLRNALSARILNDEKMEQFFILERWNSFGKTVGMCFFGPAPRSYITPEEVLEAVNAATGWDLTIEDALKIGERGTNLARVFNNREGFSRKDDTLPQRIFEPLEGGVLTGEAYPREGFEKALTYLYGIKGWNPERGVPTRDRLESLSLDWAAELIDL